MSNPGVQHRLYYFGRSCLWIFVILFGEGLALPYLFKLPDGAPPYVVRYFSLMTLILPWAAPVGVIASLGLMRRQTWARRILCTLFLGGIGVAVWFVGAMLRFEAATSDPSKLVGGSAAGVLLVVLLGWASRQVATVPFDEVDGSQ